MIRLTPGERFVLATILIVVVLLVAACGGGSSSASVPAPQRTDLLFGYFGDCDTCVAETRGHTNLQSVVGWGNDGWRQHAIEAAAAGQKIMLSVCWKCGPENIRWQFGVMRADGTLSSVVALYPQDEPDVARMSDADVASMVGMVRSVAGEFVELHDIPIAAIYGSIGVAGIEHFDWIGRDNYGTGPIVPIRQPNQRVILIPGGADPWREDPQAFLDTANRTPAVVAIMPFLWRDPAHLQGIATNGLAQTYCTSGLQVTGRAGPC
jgi:hypothetical protein